jgi:hypothetical protein
MAVLAARAAVKSPAPRTSPEALTYRRTGGHPPFCSEIEAGLGEVVRAAQQATATPPLGQQPDLAGAAVAPAQLAEQHLRVGLPGVAADQHDAMGGPQIDRKRGYRTLLRAA